MAWSGSWAVPAVSMGGCGGHNSLTLLSKNYGTMAPLTGDVKTRADHTIAPEAGARLCASIRHDVRASLGHERLQTVRCHGSHSKTEPKCMGCNAIPCSGWLR